MPSAVLASSHAMRKFPFTRVTVPQHVTLTVLVIESAKRHPERVALVDSASGRGIGLPPSSIGELHARYGPAAPDQGTAWRFMRRIHPSG